MRENGTSENLPEISSQVPIPHSHMPGEKGGNGKGIISQKRYIKCNPASTIKFLVHWLIVFYLGLSHRPLFGPSLAQCLLGTAVKRIISKQNFEHITPQIQGHPGTTIIYSSTLLFWLTHPFLLCSENVSLSYTFSVTSQFE